MKNPKPIESDATRETDTDATTVLRRLTIPEVEQQLLETNDETRTDLQPIIVSQEPK
jgi:hypothetical protein